MKLGQKLLVSIGTMFIFSETSSENEFPLAATPADKKLIYLSNQIYAVRCFANISTIRYIPLDGMLISQQHKIFR